jgi:hypothetical protein
MKMEAATATSSPYSAAVELRSVIIGFGLNISHHIGAYHTGFGCPLDLYGIRICRIE